MPAAPAASCAKCWWHTSVATTGPPEHPAFPHAMVLTVYVVLSPVTGLFCHRRQRIKVLSVPGRADKTSANLTPASGRQDHTILPSAAIVSRQRAVVRSQAFRPALRPFARKTLPRPPHPVPNVRDDRDTPLFRDGMPEVLEVIWGKRKQENFCKRGSTARINRLSRLPTAATPAARASP